MKSKLKKAMFEHKTLGSLKISGVQKKKKKKKRKIKKNVSFLKIKIKIEMYVS